MLLKHWQILVTLVNARTYFQIVLNSRWKDSHSSLNSVTTPPSFKVSCFYNHFHFEKFMLKRTVKMVALHNGGNLIPLCVRDAIKS